MKLFVIGGTGRTGRLFLDQAVDQKHAVTALARNPAALASYGEKLRAIAGDVLKPATLEGVLGGHDAVIAILTPTGGRKEHNGTTLFSEGGMNIVRAMEAQGVKRLVFAGSSAVDKEDPAVKGFFFNWIIKPLLNLEPLYVDLRKFEERVTASSLEWTIARGPRLVDGPKTGKYRVSPRFLPPGGDRISRADYAEFILAQAASREFIRGVPSLCY